MSVDWLAGERLEIVGESWEHRICMSLVGRRVLGDLRVAQRVLTGAVPISCQPSHHHRARLWSMSRPARPGRRSVGLVGALLRPLAGLWGGIGRVVFTF